MRQIRIFLSSPGDVPEERAIARRLIKEVLPVDPFIRGKVNLDIVSWDDPDAPASLPAHLPPQVALERGLPAPSDCDIVLVLLWSRIGTVAVRPDGMKFRSGTEWEYHDALEALRGAAIPAGENNKRVRSILLYRRTETPSIPLTASEEQRIEALSQWSAVQDFFAQLTGPEGTALGGINQYKDPQDFERILAHQLKTEINILIREQDQATLNTSPPPSNEGAFIAPSFDHTISREPAVRHLLNKRGQSCILIVTGLSGNGKSVLAAQFAKLIRTTDVTSALWIDCEEGESLESLVARLSQKAAITSQTTKAQCKELLAFLRRTNSVLFLDDFQGCNHESMEPLLAMAAGQGGPARLVLVSRILPDAIVALPGVTIHPVEDFTTEEIGALLQQKGVTDLNDAMVRDLVQKTGALPLAVALFCGLISLGANARDLLDGELIEAERMKRWFDELGRMLSDRAVRLLGLLSLVDGTFEEPLAHMFLSGASESDVRREFHTLRRAYLVERYNRDKWKVHDLVASIGRASLAQEIVHGAHAALGRHYRQLAFDAEDAGHKDLAFEYAVKACRAFDKNGEKDDLLERTLSTLAPTIKMRGAHIVFLELARNLIYSRRVSDLWIEYHFAHCCFVLGLFDETIEHARRILQSATRRDATLRLSASRLYSEALAAIGDLDRAYENLSGALEATRAKPIDPTAFGQACSALAGIETDLGKFGAAHEHIQRLLVDAAPASIGEAVALCRMGILQLALKKNEDAKVSLQSAVNLFRRLEYSRGEAWALVALARTAFATHAYTECAAFLGEAIPIQEAIGGYNPEYEHTLQEFLSDAPQSNVDLRSLVVAEIARIDELKLERRSFARRLSPRR